MAEGDVNWTKLHFQEYELFYETMKHDILRSNNTLPTHSGIDREQRIDRIYTDSNSTMIEKLQPSAGRSIEEEVATVLPDSIWKLTKE